MNESTGQPDVRNVIVSHGSPFLPEPDPLVEPVPGTGIDLRVAGGSRAADHPAT